MTDCYPDVQEGLSTSGRECFTMGTAFLSPLRTAGGGCCTHKLDGPVPMEPEDLFGQFDESEKFAKTFLCPEMCFDEKGKKFKKKVKSERNADCRGTSPVQTADRSAEGHHPAQSGQSVWDSPVTHCLLSSEPRLLPACGVTGETFPIFAQASRQISDRFPLERVLLLFISPRLPPIMAGSGDKDIHRADSCLGKTLVMRAGGAGHL